MMRENRGLNYHCIPCNKKLFFAQRPDGIYLCPSCKRNASPGPLDASTTT